MAGGGGGGRDDAIPTVDLDVRSADTVEWADLELVFGSGMPARCNCQRYLLARGDSFAATPDEVRRDALREQSHCGSPGAPTTGVVGFVDGEPVAWCSVRPRSAYGSGLLRSGSVARHGDGDPDDPTVWSITCFVTRPGFRRRGIATALVPAAVRFAASRGATAVEAYPMTTSKAILVELHPGTEAMFVAAGFSVVSRPTSRRAVVRRELPSDPR